MRWVVSWHSCHFVPGRVRCPSGAENSSLHHRVQNGSAAHPASYPVGTGGSFLGGKAAGAWNWPYLHLLLRSKNEWSYTSAQYVFMAWCSVKAQGQLYLYPLDRRIRGPRSGLDAKTKRSPVLPENRTPDVKTVSSHFTAWARCRSEDNIKTDIRYHGEWMWRCEQDKVQGWALVNTVINVRIPYKGQFHGGGTLLLKIIYFVMRYCQYDKHNSPYGTCLKQPHSVTELQCMSVESYEVA
jgi:hypothetical protein